MGLLNGLTADDTYHRVPIHLPTYLIKVHNRYTELWSVPVIGFMSRRSKYLTRATPSLDISSLDMNPITGTEHSSV